MLGKTRRTAPTTTNISISPGRSGACHGKISPNVKFKKVEIIIGICSFFQMNSQMDFEKCYTGLSSEEVFVEYLDFIRSLPDLIETEKKKIICVVEKELKIMELSRKIASFDFKTLVNRKPSHFLDHLVCKLGYSLKILCPPVKSCLLCRKGLTVNNKPSQVIVHKITGPEIYPKFLYRCRDC